MRMFARPALACAGAVLSATLLAGCADHVVTEPSAEASDRKSVDIVVDPDDTDQVVLGEIYRQTLARAGREATVLKEDKYQSHGDKGRSLNPEGNFYVGCTGDFLNFLNPSEARDISQDYKKAEEDTQPGGEDFLARTHIALMSSLPTDLATVEPSGAYGCEDAEPELPENFVVVYQKGLFDREEEIAFASLTKFITQKDLSDLAEDAEEKGSVEKAVREWMQSSGGDIVDGEGDSASTGGSDLTSS
ncbi:MULTISPECIES: hypothetical protein [Corynebacterium]|uniref:hypothetical protein n=1 Tax=Corynebacterium TaxID=1716 RepID=UPI0003B83BB7|nr:MULTISPECIES: hypothetical protein [Corynebacterium]ERS58137.1 hypothetical protein HMPREF1261_02196 [Corynebacterium sp. KPL1818]MDK8498525.1 hypothetical protein [Corynebacterium accolens]